MQAETIFDLVPTGNYVIIKGNSADANADFLRAGMEEVIGDAVAAGDITIVGETYTDNWDPATRPDGDGAVPHGEPTTTSRRCCRRTTAWPVASSPPSMPRVSPARCPWGARTVTSPALNRVALGTQTVSVWKDSRLLGQAAGEAAVQLCADPDISAVAGTAPFASPGGNELTSIQLNPQPITQDNLDVVLDAGIIDQATLCQGVEPGTVPVCDATGGSAGSAAERRHTAAAAAPSRDDGRLTTPSPSMCLRPAPASWRRTHCARRRHHDC